MRITRLCALLLALTLLLLPSCSKKKTEEPEPPEADIEEAANGPSVLFLSAETDPDLLTGIWVGKEYLLEDAAVYLMDVKGAGDVRCHLFHDTGLYRTGM